MEGGLVVNENFKYRHPETGIWLSGSSIVTPVTLYEQLVNENEAKKEIYLLKKNYLSQFVDEFDKLVAYDGAIAREEEAPLTRTSISEKYI